MMDVFELYEKLDKANITYRVGNDNNIVLTNRRGFQVPIGVDNNGRITSVGGTPAVINNVTVDRDGITFVSKELSYKIRL